MSYLTFDFPHTRTYDTDIGWLVEAYKKLICEVNNIMAWENLAKEQIADLQAAVSRLENEIQKIENGEYSQLYIQALTNWLNNNMTKIVGSIVKYVFFGLTNDGYFAAYIPPTWDFIQFDTIMNPNSELYGHLVLRW